jgi:choline dehydrogenase-like flavoprotein
LRALKTDHVDLLFLHDPLPGSVRSDEVSSFLENARVVGLIRSWGIAGAPETTGEVAQSFPRISAVGSMMGGGTHQLGTTRMASQADDCVVNEYLAIHGVTNLFVASSSVFLTSSQANPTFMILVLALRLTDRLKLILGVL